MPRNPETNEQMRAESQKKILETAGAPFAQKGYFNVRMAEIGQQARMSPGNIYLYFSSKEEILKAILVEYFAAFDDLWAQAEQDQGSGLDKLNRLIDDQLAFSGAYGQHKSIFLSIMSHGGPELLSSLGLDLVTIGQGFHRHVETIFRQAIAEGFLAPAEPAHLAVLFFSFFNGLQVTYGESMGFVPPQVVRQSVLKMLGYSGPA